LSLHSTYPGLASIPQCIFPRTCAYYRSMHFSLADKKKQKTKTVQTFGTASLSTPEKLNSHSQEEGDAVGSFRVKTLSCHFVQNYRNRHQNRRSCVGRVAVRLPERSRFTQNYRNRHQRNFTLAGECDLTLPRAIAFNVVFHQTELN